MKYSLISIFILFNTAILAQKSISENFNSKRNVAISGYDPVSYFQNDPKEGNSSWTAKHQGVTYYFINESNRSQFNSAPNKYVPQYGGWCAYAMGDTGEKVKIDPETYKISNGKLFLFYNFWGTNTLELWNDDEVKLKPKADKNWSGYLD